MTSAVTPRLVSLALTLLLSAGALPGHAVLAQAAAEIEPNDDAGSATAVVGSFEIAGDATATDDWFSWRVDDDGSAWTVEIESPTNQTIALEVFDQEGSLGWARSVGLAAVPDLLLTAAEYLVRVSYGGAEPLPYVLRANEQAEVFDPEPNDDVNPVPLPDGMATTGRLGRTGSDEDRFRLDVPAGDSMLRDIRLTWPTTTQRMLCLLDDDGRSVMCHRDDDGDVDILDLALAPGQHIFSVSGESEPDDPYTLTVDATRRVTPDYEAEPNDAPPSAAALDLELGVEGRGSFQDPDVFRATVEGETQLWRLTAEGPGVQRLFWILPAGDELASVRADDRGRAVLDDLLLSPGDHYFRLYSDEEAAYSLSATPLGPPERDVEREPNSTVALAERFSIGQRRVGRLASIDDLDHFRFTAAAREHIRLRLEPPADADLQLVLQTRGQNLVQTRGVEPGRPIDLDLLLQPGDYLVILRPYGASDEPYVLTTERLDPFDTSVDQEPNEEMTTAQPIPPSMRWTGHAAVASELDWYQLPALTEPGPVRIEVDAEAAATVRASDGAEPLEVTQEEPGRYTIADPPLDSPFYVLVRARRPGPYGVSIDAPGSAPRPDPVEPPVALDISVASGDVAAYWPQAQRVDGVLELVNDGSEDLRLDLQAVTSHHAWSVQLPASKTVPAGGRLDVPFAVDILPDVWAEDAVRVSIRAVAPDGGQVSTGVDLRSRPDAVPAAPSTPFAVPEPLLGGLNVASSGSGAVPVDPSQEPIHDEEMLYDDVTPDGKGMWVKPVPLPVELIVDLAGDVPVPIAGTMLNPQAYPYDLRSMPASFELLLSTDGSTWETALSDVLSPLPVEQAFVLDVPMMATHAMLRIHSTHGDEPRTMTLGEWKVVAEPGTMPDGVPADLAEPVRGGHVVRFEPFFDRLELGAQILDADLSRDEVTLRADDDRFELVFGFKDARAAQLTGLAWRDPDGSVPEARVERVDIEVSIDGALGPWQPVGEWVLDRGDDGAVDPFEFDDPTWARYVRLSSPLTLEPPARLEMPADIGAYEHPTSDDYRSVLGEWGYTSPLGPYEWMASEPDVSPITLDADAGDTREMATLLQAERSRTDSVEAGADEDWYAIQAPPVTSSLEFAIGGVDGPNVRPILFEAGGDMVPLAVAPPREPGVVRYVAPVDPGARYLLRVEQPPLSTVIAYDTSDSMVPYMPFVRSALRTFVREVVPGLDAVKLLPFEEAPLLDTWQDQPDKLQDAVNNHIRVTRSSGAEAALMAASDLLADRDGTRAILLLTDAETSSYSQTPMLWPRLGDVEPVVFAVNLGATSNPARARDLMQGWALANGGHYVYASTHASVDRAFERMTTWLRRPAIYELRMSPSDVALEPARLAVAPPPRGSVALAPDTGIGIILDTSGSMRKRLEGKRRINIAKASLRELLGRTIREGTPVAVRTLGPGNRKWKCRSRLELPLAPLDRDAALRWVKEVKAPKKAGTPLTDALEQIPGDLAEVGNRIVVVVTDGNESCGGDPTAAVEALEAEGIETTLNIVGFALDDEALKAEMARWAEAGSGTYYDAAGADELLAAIKTATAARFEVYAPDSDAPVASGSVGGDAVEVPPGRYRVEVITEPAVDFDVELGWGDFEQLQLPASPDG